MTDGHQPVAEATLRIQAPAKVNLFLKITGRRSDGYHTLETLMQKVDLYDTLDISRRRTGVELHCSDDELPVNRDNLVYRAAEVFLETTADRLTGRDTGVTITLHKRIPIAAGLGGGSSDAAAVLRGMRHLFDVDCSQIEMAAMGLGIGADVPFFLHASPACWATGIGERLLPAVGLNDMALVLVNPGFAVSTRWAYQNFALTKPKKIFNLCNSQSPAVEEDRLCPFTDRGIASSELFNDLEKVTAGKHKEIAALKEQLLAGGAEAALMSGSGPTVFGLFTKPDRAKCCWAQLKKIHTQTYMVHPLQGEQLV